MNKKELIVLEPKRSLLREHEPPYTAGNMYIIYVCILCIESIRCIYISIDSSGIVTFLFFNAEFENGEIKMKHELSLLILLHTT